MNIIRTALISLIISPMFFVSSAHADISATLSLEPKNPLPNSPVAITIDSYSFDVNTSFIYWKIGGKTVLEGEGAKTLTITTGGVGVSTVIVVGAKTADGNAIEQQVTISPSSVLLIYEAPRSYVPLFYEGRSLPSTGGIVRVTALPQISDDSKILPASSLSFTWYLNDTVLKDISGIGKQSANIRLDYLETENEIKVVARSPLGNTGTKTITVYAHPIMPLLYQYDQILGTNFNTLISRRFETVSDFTLALEPFYVSQKENTEPTYEWFLNGLPATPLGGKILSLHPKEDSYGSKTLTIKVNGPDRRLQNAETKVDLVFDTRK